MPLTSVNTIQERKREIKKKGYLMYVQKSDNAEAIALMLLSKVEWCLRESFIFPDLIFVHLCSNENCE